MYLKTVISILYSEAELTIDVLGKTFKGVELIGRHTVSSIYNKEHLFIRGEIESFLEEFNIPKENIIVGITPDQVAFRKISLPLEVEEELEDAISLQIMNLVPSDLTDFYVEKIVRKNEEGNCFDVFLFIIPREKVETILKFFSDIDFYPQWLTITALGYEKIISGNSQLRGKNIFICDLSYESFSVYCYRNGKFEYFKHTWIIPGPRGKEISQVLKEVEKTASLVRLPEEEDVEIFLNFTDESWKEKIDRSQYPFLRHINEITELPITYGDLNSFAVGYLGLYSNRRSFNLIPKERRVFTSSISYIPTLALVLVLIVLLFLNLTSGYFQKKKYLEEIERGMAKIEKKYKKVVKIKQRISATKDEINVLNKLMIHPISNLEVIRELTEKAGPKTYIDNYNRNVDIKPASPKEKNMNSFFYVKDTLTISGYTESSLDYQTRLMDVKFFNSVIMNSSTKSRRNDLERFQFKIVISEEKNK